jgi:hypothetical protein
VTCREESRIKISTLDNIAYCFGENFRVRINAEIEEGDNEIKWFKDGLELAKFNEANIVVNEPGVYTCTAKNIGGCTVKSLDTIIIERQEIQPTVGIQLLADSIYLNTNISNPTVVWYHNDKLVNNLTGTAIHPELNGSYRAEVFNEIGCFYETNSINFENGVDKLADQTNPDFFDGSSVTLFPNPTPDFALIKSGQVLDPILGYEIISQDGTIIQSERFEVRTYQQQVSLIDCPKGNYMVRVRTKNDVFLERISKI